MKWVLIANLYIIIFLLVLGLSGIDGAGILALILALILATIFSVGAMVCDEIDKLMNEIRKKEK